MENVNISTISTISTVLKLLKTVEIVENSTIGVQQLKNQRSFFQNLKNLIPKSTLTTRNQTLRKIPAKTRKSMVSDPDPGLAQDLF